MMASLRSCHACSPVEALQTSQGKISKMHIEQIEFVDLVYGTWLLEL